MLEQEMASIAKFILSTANMAKPYYNRIQEGFVIPSIFFPPAEIESSAFSLSSHEITYAWVVKFFGYNTENANSMAIQAMYEIVRNRCIIPLYDLAGNLTGVKIHIKYPEAKIIEEGVAQLYIQWSVVRSNIEDVRPKACNYEIVGWNTPDDSGTLQVGDLNYIERRK